MVSQNRRILAMGREEGREGPRGGGFTIFSSIDSHRLSFISARDPRRCREGQSEVSGCTRESRPLRRYLSAIISYVLLFSGRNEVLFRTALPTSSPGRDNRRPSVGRNTRVEGEKPRRQRAGRGVNRFRDASGDRTTELFNLFLVILPRCSR